MYLCLNNLISVMFSEYQNDQIFSDNRHKTHTCMPAVSAKEPRTEDDDGDLRNIHPDQVLSCIIIACSRHRGRVCVCVCVGGGGLLLSDLNDTIVTPVTMAIE